MFSSLLNIGVSDFPLFSCYRTQSNAPMPPIITPTLFKLGEHTAFFSPPGSSVRHGTPGVSLFRGKRRGSARSLVQPAAFFGRLRLNSPLGRPEIFWFDQPRSVSIPSCSLLYGFRMPMVTRKMHWWSNLRWLSTSEGIFSTRTFREVWDELEKGWN